jgi:hypothetical protein
MPDQSLLRQAATCYQRGGWPHEAARCYREAGSPGLAARAWEDAGAMVDAATDFAAAGMVGEAGWLLVHHLGDPTAARAVIAGIPVRERSLGPGAIAFAPLLDRLVLARCDVADGVVDRESRDALSAVMDRLANRGRVSTPENLESWAVLTAEAMQRPDLVALIFAAAVRGHHHGALARWREWSQRALHEPLVLPPGEVITEWVPVEPTSSGV